MSFDSVGGHIVDEAMGILEVATAMSVSLSSPMALVRTLSKVVDLDELAYFELGDVDPIRSRVGLTRFTDPDEIRTADKTPAVARVSDGGP